MNYVGYMVSNNGYVPLDSIGWSKSFPLVNLFLKGIQYLDDETYTPTIIESVKENFEDVNNLELNGLLDLDTMIEIKQSKDKTISIASTSSQIDMLTADFDKYTVPEYYNSEIYYDKFSCCINYIADSNVKRSLKKFASLVRDQYNIESYADIDLVKWLVLNDYILPIY